MRHRDPTRPVGEVQLPVVRDRPDNTRREVVFSIGPDLLAVERDLVLVSVTRFEVRDPDQGIMVAFDLEGACLMAEDLDLTGGVGLDPDGRVALTRIAQERAENEA